MSFIEVIFSVFHFMNPNFLCVEMGLLLNLFECGDSTVNCRCRLSWIADLQGQISGKAHRDLIMQQIDGDVSSEFRVPLWCKFRRWGSLTWTRCEFQVSLWYEFRVQELRGNRNSHHCPFIALLFGQLSASWWSKLYALYQSKHLIAYDNNLLYVYVHLVGFYLGIVIGGCVSAIFFCGCASICHLPWMISVKERRTYSCCNCVRKALFSYHHWNLRYAL